MTLKRLRPAPVAAPAEDNPYESQLGSEHDDTR